MARPFAALAGAAALIRAGAAWALPEGALELERTLALRSPPHAVACAARAGRSDLAAPISEPAGMAAARGCGEGLSQADLSALAFIFMVEAAKSAQKNLDAIRAGIRAQTPAGGANAQDSQSDLSEQQQIRLQMQMDRTSKAETAISNMMKHIGDTDAAIVGNLK